MTSIFRRALQGFVTAVASQRELLVAAVLLVGTVWMVQDYALPRLLHRMGSVPINLAYLITEETHIGGGCMPYRGKYAHVGEVRGCIPRDVVQESIESLVARKPPDSTRRIADTLTIKGERTIYGFLPRAYLPAS